MRIFSCPSCGGEVNFSNTDCLACGQPLHFDIAVGDFVAAGADCANRPAIGCNWVAGDSGLCWSCAMTRVIPETMEGENRLHWAKSETAKRRVLAQLGRWGWFTPADTGRLPVFRMLSEVTSDGPRDVVMAHGDGEITINVTEADVLERMERREELGEKLRTMIGHIRHEIAHFLFLRLCDAPDFLPAFRALMGDETADYAAALARHYDAGPPEGWGAAHVTPYASAHPHEDWAETLAHLLHLVDIIDCAVAAGWTSAEAPAGYDAYAEPDGQKVITLGADYAMGVNHINRSIGLGDIYPFVLTDGVRDKLAFVHGWLGAGPVAVPVSSDGTS